MCMCVHVCVWVHVRVYLCVCVCFHMSLRACVYVSACLILIYWPLWSLFQVNMHFHDVCVCVTIMYGWSAEGVCMHLASCVGHPKYNSLWIYLAHIGMSRQTKINFNMRHKFACLCYKTFHPEFPLVNSYAYLFIHCYKTFHPPEFPLVNSYAYLFIHLSKHLALLFDYN